MSGFWVYACILFITYIIVHYIQQNATIDFHSANNSSVVLSIFIVIFTSYAIFITYIKRFKATHFKIIFKVITEHVTHTLSIEK